MQKVFKYPLPIDDINYVDLPKGAKILHVNKQHGDDMLYIWALVNPNETQTEERMFRVAGTGHPISENVIAYLGTVFLHGNSLVFHVFEVN